MVPMMWYCYCTVYYAVCSYYRLTILDIVNIIFTYIVDPISTKHHLIVDTSLSVFPFI